MRYHPCMEALDDVRRGDDDSLKSLEHHPCVPAYRSEHHAHACGQEYSFEQFAQPSRNASIGEG